MSDNQTNSDCLFCPSPEKITEWWYEDDTCLVIDKPDGDPMVVLKRHTKNPTESEYEHINESVNQLFGSHERFVHMGHVPEHFHAHIENYEKHPRDAE